MRLRPRRETSPAVCDDSYIVFHLVHEVTRDSNTIDSSEGPEVIFGPPSRERGLLGL